MSQDFPGLHEMADVGTGEMSAGVASAAILDWCAITGILRVAQIDPAPAGERCPIARHASRQDAIENIYAARNAIHQVFRAADTHQVAWLTGWKQRNALIQSRQHLRFGLANGQSANCVAWKIQRSQFPR